MKKKFARMTVDFIVEVPEKTDVNGLSLIIDTKDIDIMCSSNGPNGFKTRQVNKSKVTDYTTQEVVAIDED